jgi:hypothetical protein
MRSIKTIAPWVIIFALSEAAVSQESITVQSLLKHQFAVVGTLASPIGPGLFLQKADRLFLCFVSETPQSQTVTTRYCKPVQ